VPLSFLVVATLCHWWSFREEITDVARARSSFSKIIRQLLTMFVCLCTSSGFPSGKKLLREIFVCEGLIRWCTFNHKLWAMEILKFSGVLSPCPSVQIGRGLLRKILLVGTFYATSLAHFRGKGLSKRLFCMSHRHHTSRWKSDWTTRQWASSQHGARAYSVSQHIDDVCVAAIDRRLLLLLETAT